MSEKSKVSVGETVQEIREQKELHNRVGKMILHKETHEPTYGCPTLVSLNILGHTPEEQREPNTLIGFLHEIQRRIAKQVR